MLTEDGKHLYVSYDEYHNLIEKLAIKVHQSGWQFDTILCLARGGMRPGDILSRIFNKPLAIMSTSSYRADAGTVQGIWTSRATSPHPRVRSPARCCWWTIWLTPATR
jgi:hypoxanthine phosphoribosyltransferase